MMDRFYQISSMVRKRIATSQNKGDEVEVIKAEILDKNGVLFVVEDIPAEVFSDLRYQIPNYPSAREVRFSGIGSNGRSLWTSRYDLPAKAEPLQPSFHGLGMPDIGALVEKQVKEIRTQEELERLREIKKAMEARQAEQDKEIEELQAKIDAKSNIEYYSNLAGNLLPGIAKFLEKTPLGPALGAMAGNNATSGDDRTTVVQTAAELVKNISDEQLSALYMTLLELQSNPDLIQRAYQSTQS
jgi:hypothetical protein